MTYTAQHRDIHYFLVSLIAGVKTTRRMGLAGNVPRTGWMRNFHTVLLITFKKMFNLFTDSKTILVKINEIECECKYKNRAKFTNGIQNGIRSAKNV